MTLVLGVIQTILDIINGLVQTNLEELKALDGAAKTARATAMAQEQADTRAFWKPTIDILVGLAAKFPVPPT